MQRGLNRSFAVTLPPQLRVGNDVLEEAVASSSAKQVRCDNEHAGRSDTIAIIGHEDAYPRLRQGFLPDALGALSRLGDGTHLRHLKKREE
jgi:hypothetical protein